MALELGGGVETSAERRLFIARSLGAGAASVAAAASGAALYNGRSLPVVRHVEVKLKRLPKHLDGFKIVQISDLHVSATIRRPYVERVVAMANDLSPDLVALTGDLVDGDVPALRHDFAPLGELKSRYGSFFCTGNHEYYSGADSWLDELRRIGVRPLRNEHVVVGEREGQQGLVVAGIDDAQAARFGGDHGPDLQRALTGVHRERAVLLLAHQPKAVAEAAEAGVDLQLSGHTHGGQMWPFGYLVRLVQPYVAGLHQHTDETQFTSTLALDTGATDEARRHQRGDMCDPASHRRGHIKPSIESSGQGPHHKGYGQASPFNRHKLT